MVGEEWFGEADVRDVCYLLKHEWMDELVRDYSGRLVANIVYYHEAQAISMYECNTTNTNRGPLVLNTTPTPNKHRRDGK